MKIFRIFSNIDKKKAFQLFCCVIGLYSMYLIWGFLLQKMTTTVYSNQNSQNFFNVSAGIIFIEKVIVYLCGVFYREKTVPNEKRVQIPFKNSASLGFLLYFSQIAYFTSIKIIGYPFVIMTRSCSILNVILIAIFCTRIKTKQLKLGPQKIQMAVILTLGLILFRIFDPNFSLDQTNFQFLGILLLLLSLFADGFIVDFQAQAKQIFRPTPIEMVVQFNKYCGLFSLIHLVFCGQIAQLASFFVNYHSFALDALLFSLTGFFGQLFIYRIVENFKQHMLPLLMATRRIITIILSILYFGHQTSLGQIIGMLVVFIVVISEVLEEIRISIQKKTKFKEILQEKYK